MDPRDSESIRRDLESRDEEVRRLAVQRLVVLGDDEALELLGAQLGDPSWRVRKAVVERLAARPDSERVCSLLVAALCDGEDPGRRNAAVEGLVRCGERSVPALLEASASDDVDVRKLAVDALAGIADLRSARRLVAMLDDADANVRGAAADALGEMGCGSAQEALLRVGARDDEDPLVRLSALRALVALEAEPTPAQLEGALHDPLLRPAAFVLLGRSDEPAAAEILVKGLGAGSRSAREAAMEALVQGMARKAPGAAGALRERIREAVASLPGLVEEAVARLEDSDLPRRLGLVQFLGLLDRPETVVPLLHAGCDEALAEVVLGTLAELDATTEGAIEAGWERLDADARTLACRVLGRCGGPLARRRLMSALDDPDPEVRGAAAGGLAECGTPEATPALLRRLELASSCAGWDGEAELVALGTALERIASVHGATHEGAELVEQLAARLPLAGDAERVQMARVLGHVRQPSAVEAAALLLSDPSATVRRTAVEALSRLDDTAEPLRVALLDEAPLVRVAAAGALAAAPHPEAVEDLACLAQDEDARVRGAALRAAAERAASTSGAERERLLGILGEALGDEGAVALAAVEGLDRVGDQDAARSVLPALESDAPEILQAAIRCLGVHGSVELLDRLLPLVAHPHWAVRAEAIQVLSERGVARAVPPVLRRLEAEQDEFVRAVILRALRRLEG